MISAVVLAAGTSSRLGKPKQLLELAGRPVLQHVVDTAEASPVDEVVVVLGHRAEAIMRAIRRGPRTRFVVNEAFEEGVSTSLASGLAAVEPASEAAVVLLGDQPGVRARDIAAVVDAWRSGAGPVVQVGYGGRPAHPTLLARAIWSELASIGGDEGARSVLRAHPQWRRTVEVGGRPPDDIDTVEDYARVRQAFEDPPSGG